MTRKQRKISGRIADNRLATLFPGLTQQAFMKSWFPLISIFFLLSGLTQPGLASEVAQTKFKRIPTQHIAALGAPNASFGDGAESWGLWPLDPGPRGGWLKIYEQLDAAGGIAPANWRFNNTDWRFEEHGLIMEEPEFPLPVGKYLVTGNRNVVAMLTIYPEDADGARQWELDSGATLYDVTHLACCSARYTPTAGDESCTPAMAKQAAFPVNPGAAMPAVEGCQKQDYSVLLVVGVEEKD